NALAADVSLAVPNERLHRRLPFVGVVKVEGALAPDARPLQWRTWPALNSQSPVRYAVHSLRTTADVCRLAARTSRTVTPAAAAGGGRRWAPRRRGGRAVPTARARC